MNPQPPESLGQLVALLFSLLVIYYAIKAYYNNPPIHINDLYTIGYVEESKNPSIINVVTNKPNFESQQIYIDCIDALYSLGMKKSEAKRKTKEIFSSMDNPPSSIQEFLMIALRNNI